jgi:hypothetical protein
MRYSYPLAAVVVICLGVAIALLIPHGQVASADPKPAPEPPVGRYQVFRHQDGDIGDCLLDTATGKVWRFENPKLARTKWVLVAEEPK